MDFESSQCPACGSMLSQCIDTRILKIRGVELKMRIRYCRHCFTKYRTKEIVDQELTQSNKRDSNTHIHTPKKPANQDEELHKEIENGRKQLEEMTPSDHEYKSPLPQDDANLPNTGKGRKGQKYNSNGERVSSKPEKVKKTRGRPRKDSLPKWAKDMEKAREEPLPPIETPEDKAEDGPDIEPLNYDIFPPV